MRYLLAAAAACLAAGTASADTIYSNGFSTDANGFSGTVNIATTPSGESYLELYNGQTTTLSLDTSNYTGLTLTFDLYAIGSVDGNGEYGGGADPFVVSVNGATLFNYNVANYGGDTQNYDGDPATSGIDPMTGQNYRYAPRTGATANGTLGYGTGDYGDSTYLVTLNLGDLSGLTTISFSGDTNEDPGNENYGIDNVSLTGTPNTVPGGVPEPASWALMISGFGLVGGNLRRRAAAIA